MEKILTVPDTEKEYRKYLATGNEYLSIPSILGNGEIETMNVILDRTRSLIDFSGKYLVKPQIRIHNRSLTLTAKKSWYEKSWIPSFEYEGSGLWIMVRIISPKGFKGLVYGITVKNITNAELDITCGVEGIWAESSSTVFHTREIFAKKCISWHRWTNSLILELKDSLTLVALGISGDSDYELNYDQAAMTYAVTNRTRLKSNEEKVFYYYYSVNMEPDGAGAVNIDLRRRGGESLYADELRWLGEHRVEPDDPSLENRMTLEEKMNRNLLFSYFFATGYALDTEEQVLLTSRSPKYYVSAAFWARDSLLWSFPAICIIDQQEAKKVLYTCFTRYLKNAGIHSLYTNGSVLYSGFELDELAAYVIALEEYIEWTHDKNILDAEEIQRGLHHLVSELERRHSGEDCLYRTELDPSDDPISYPYLIYDNVLVWKALVFLSQNGYVSPKAADELRIAIEKHGIAEGVFGPMYAWSTDCGGHHEIYDNPPGSLVLLAYYGFCSRDDEVYRNTLKWIYSEHNKHRYQSPRFDSTGCIHTPFPWLISICNYLLVFHDESRLRMIEELELDNGFACESFDSESGIVKTGGAFATCAGFLGYTLARLLKNHGIHG